MTCCSLSSHVSWQIWDDRAVVLDHASGRDIALNVEAGRLIARVAEKDTSFSADERDFIEQLTQLGIVYTEKDASVHVSRGPVNVQPPGDNDVFTELREYASRELIPITAIAELTYNCGLRCPHCYLGKNPRVDNPLSRDEWLDFLDEFRALGGLYLVITGGDPLLHDDIMPVFEGARNRYLAVSILSSGQVYSEKMLEIFAQRGLFSFQVSFHGMSERHDNFTGVPGAFNRGVRSLRFLRDRGVHVQAALNIHTRSLPDFPAMRRFFTKQNIPHVNNYAFYSKRDGDRTPEQLNITDEQLSYCLQDDPPAGRQRFSEKQPDDPPCDAARNLLSISPNGTVYPCLEIRQPAGNIRTISFAEIWRHASVFDRIRSLRVSDLAICGTCPDAHYCNRCPGRACAAGNSLTGVSPTDCTYARALRMLKNDSGEN